MKLGEACAQLFKVFKLTFGDGNMSGTQENIRIMTNYMDDITNGNVKKEKILIKSNRRMSSRVMREYLNISKAMTQEMLVEN